MSKEDLEQTLDLYRLNNYNQTKTATELGLARSGLQYRLTLAAKMGMVAGKGAPGMLVDKVSTFRDKDGETIGEWTILKPDAISYQAALEAIDEAMKKYDSYIPVIPSPVAFGNADLVTVYPIIDHHLGLYSWEPETGANYDLGIASKLLRESAEELMASTPPSRQAVILNIGDFFHSDDNTNRTRRSGNILDADGRYAKILEVGVDLEIYLIELALTKHETVEVRNLPGNHDPYASIALNSAIRMAFRNNPRVHVSRDPSPFYFFRFGKVLIGATHGDMIKHSDMPSVMAAYVPKDWGETEHRYIYLGHVHHASVGGGERYGATWETFRTLAAKDAWATQSGYASGRSMVAITHHRETGEKYRNTVTLSGPGFKQRS